MILYYWVYASLTAQAVALFMIARQLKWWTREKATYMRTLTLPKGSKTLTVQIGGPRAGGGGSGGSDSGAWVHPPNRGGGGGGGQVDSHEYRDGVLVAKNRDIQKVLSDQIKKQMRVPSKLLKGQKPKKRK